MSPEMTKVMHAAQVRKWLLRSIELHLLPAFVQQGFTQEPQNAHEPPIDRRRTLAFPLNDLVRMRESAVDTVRIQFAPYRFNAFRINATTRPKKDDGWPISRFEMYAFPRLFALWWWSWFSVNRWPFRAPNQADYEKLALRVAGYVAELEVALHEGRLGPHLRHVVIQRPVVGGRVAPISNGNPQVEGAPGPSHPGTWDEQQPSGR